MGETRKIKVNRSVTKNKLLDYGFRYKELITKTYRI